MDLSLVFGGGPPASIAFAVYALAVAIALTGAITDYRTGLIPNWLTLPPIVVAPFAYGLLRGWDGFFETVVAIIVAGLMPWVMNRAGGMAGGDLKMFVALGAIVGSTMAIETQLFGLTIASIYAAGRLVWDGHLLQTLANTFFLFVGPVLPARFRRRVPEDRMQVMRLGGAIFAGLLLSVVGRCRSLLFEL